MLLDEKPMHGLKHDDLNQPFTLCFRLKWCYVSVEIQIPSGLWKLPVSFVYPVISRIENFFRTKVNMWSTHL